MMTKERQGEIALLQLKRELKNNGLKLRSGVSRQIASDAKELGVKPEELREFASILYSEAFADFMVELRKPVQETTSHVNPDNT